MRPVTENTDRIPAVAGLFYPAETAKLQEEMERLFKSAIPYKGEHVRAIIVPHAGYQFSGGVAASSYNQINGDTRYKRVFIIASSHHHKFRGASVWCDGDYIMPYGKEKVDKAFGKMLAGNFPDVFSSDQRVHIEEHAIETQLPFLHHVMKCRYSIVPIIIGTDDPYICREIAKVLTPYFSPENLFIVSSDFSHYPEYSAAVENDRKTMEAIISGNPERLLRRLRKNDEEGIPNLLTSLCGWTSVLILLEIIKNDESVRYYPVEYKNSGDEPLSGDHERVVGYWGIKIVQESVDRVEFELSEADKQTLLSIAKKSIEAAVNHKKPFFNETRDLSKNLLSLCGLFVTIYKNKELRGCLGRMNGDMPLWRLVQEMASIVPVHDYRFDPLTSDELGEIEIEISVLSPLRRVHDISEIRLGVHGIYIVKAGSSGVFLPQVAAETGWSVEEFLGHCSRDKAGIGWEGWREAEIYVFTATVFK
ncbi:MAG: AmmeMemoRadiSam system protein B [Bacteroidales bacterium]|nr:AmmeMemoRadiSam system protein B [Bacteroidales bacterium]